MLGAIRSFWFSRAIHRNIGENTLYSITSSIFLMESTIRLIKGRQEDIGNSTKKCSIMPCSLFFDGLIRGQEKG